MSRPLVRTVHACLALFVPVASFFTTAPALARTFVSEKHSSRLQMKIRVEDVLASPKWPESWPFSPADFRRADESPDTVFYDSPRLVYHIDDAAVGALTKYYAKTIPKTADVLDICSSWVSHYPKDHFTGGKRVGMGMNEYELSKNQQIDSYYVQDLNKDPVFPLESNSFDVVTCVVSVDYLTKPLEVFKEIGRVLRPGGIAIMSMSNRCFPTKAIQIWTQTNDLEHIFIIGSYFHFAQDKDGKDGKSLFSPPASIDISPNPGRSDPMFIVQAAKA